MTTGDESIRRYLLNRELTFWHNESESTENRLGDHPDDSEKGTQERAWYDHCYHRGQAVAIELDKLDHPES